MSLGGEDHKQHTAHQTNSNRHNIQSLLSLLLRRWVQASQHSFVSQGHSTKHQHRQNRMDPINGSDLVLGEVGKSLTNRVIEQPHAFEGGKAIIYQPVRGHEAICEGREEARGGQGQQEELRQVPGHGVTVAIVGEDWQEKLEGQERPSREKVGQVGRAG